MKSGLARLLSASRYKLKHAYRQLIYGLLTATSRFVELALKKQLEEAHKQYFQKPELQESVLTSKEVDRSGLFIKKTNIC